MNDKYQINYFKIFGYNYWDNIIEKL